MNMAIRLQPISSIHSRESMEHQDCLPIPVTTAMAEIVTVTTGQMTNSWELQHLALRWLNLANQMMIGQTTHL